MKENRLLTGEDFKLVLKELKSAYPNFNANADTCQCFFREFKEYTRNDVWYGAKAHIRKSNYPPTIASLLTEIKAQKKAREYAEKWGIEYNPKEI